jgi:thioredoxin reductase (NADPH)
MKKALIAGAGPAGLTCAIYLARAGWTVDVYSDMLNTISCLAEAGCIENYPGFPDGISGDELLGLFTSHAEKNGVSIHEEGIVKVLTDERKAVDMLGNEHEYDEYVEAVGLKRKEYTCPGIENVPVHTCAVCDGSLYGEKARGKKTHVVVIGGGDTAVSNALYLSGIAGRVTMLVRKPVCRATNVKALKELEQKSNVEIRYETVLHSVTKSNGGNAVCHLQYRNYYSDEMITDVDGIFVCIGYNANAVEHVGEGRVWKCGDCAEQHKQVAVAVGSGAKTALDIIEASR